jgi:ankyrin repeat protein
MPVVKETSLKEIHLFSGGGEEREVKLILGRSPESISFTDDEGWTPLHWACYRRWACQIFNI